MFYKLLQTNLLQHFKKFSESVKKPGCTTK